ncbi:hypothetical protein BMS3Bbin04_01139 [bacterium BMS3Bbin04]|nr:hypothetical protein BMS3Bbin04_01139 [bacterium BMS3Bbin04]
MLLNPSPENKPDSSEGSRVKEEIQHGSLAKTTAIFASGNMVGLFLRTLAGFLTASLVEPAVLGLLAAFALSLKYANFLQVGSINGLARQIPFFIGRDDYPKAKQQTAAGFAWMFLMAGIAFVVLIVLGVRELVLKDLMMASGWFTYATVVVFTLLFHTYEITYRSHSNFNKLAGIEVTRSIVSLIMLVAVYYLDFYGLLIRVWVVSLIPLILIYRFRPMKDVIPKWNFGELKQLWAVGIPIYAVVMITSLWQTVNVTLVLKIMGVEGMGLMTLALTIGTVMAVLPKAFSKVTMPRAAMIYGQGGGLLTIVKILIKPTVVLVLIVGAAVVIMIPLVAWATNLFLPKYAGGIEAAQWQLVVGGLASLQIANVALTVMRRQDIIFVNTLIGVAVWGGTLYTLITPEPYLAAFPQSMVAGQLVFLIGSYSAAIFLVIAERKGSGKRENRDPE